MAEYRRHGSHGGRPRSWWLEDTGDDALDWVRRHNEPTIDELCDDLFEQLRAWRPWRCSTPTPASLYVAAPRGLPVQLLARCRQPARPVAANHAGRYQPTRNRLGGPDRRRRARRTDDANWVWAGADVIEPDHTRALISLSRGGSDAAMVREFDMATRTFVADGFSELPEAKSQIAWEDPDTPLVGTDFGPDSMTGPAIRGW